MQGGMGQVEDCGGNCSIEKNRRTWKMENGQEEKNLEEI
jgi:hypothetical protein